MENFHDGEKSKGWHLTTKLVKYKDICIDIRGELSRGTVIPNGNQTY